MLDIEELPMNAENTGSVPAQSQNDEDRRAMAEFRRDEDRWLSVDEIAAHLGIKRETVYPWINNKNMPAHKVGRLWKFRKDEVDNWVRTGKAGSKS